MPHNSSGVADRLVLIEIALVVLLFALGVGFFLIPAAEAPFRPHWWAGILLAILFFALVFTETMRRRRRSGIALHRALDEPLEEPPADPGT